ncbi:MAG: tetratricopeptide repeat protein [Terracidiphilus sp.]
MNPVLKILSFSFFAFLTLSALSQQDSHTTLTSQRQNALHLEQRGSLAAAEQAWRAIIKAAPRNAEAYAHLGLLSARRENYREAVPLYRRALALGPGLPGIHMNLGLALFKDGKPEEAIPEFTLALNSPRVSLAEALRLRLLIGMAHYAQGQYAEAVPFLQKAAAADPQNLPVRLVLAHSCLWSQQNQCVLDAYREIVSIDPDSAEACIVAGEAMDDMKNTTGAIEQFRLAIRANPHLLGAHFGLGYLLWTQKDYDEASKEFQTELTLNPDHGQSLLYLADVDVKANRFAEARPLLERAERALPSESLAHLDMGIVLTEAGQLDDATRELKEAVRLDPDDADAHWRLSRLYRDRGDTKAANDELAKTRELKKTEHEELYRKLANGGPQTPELDTQFVPSQAQQR